MQSVDECSFVGANVSVGDGKICLARARFLKSEADEIVGCLVSGKVPDGLVA